MIQYTRYDESGMVPNWYSVRRLLAIINLFHVEYSHELL